LSRVSISFSVCLCKLKSESFSSFLLFSLITNNYFFLNLAITQLVLHCWFYGNAEIPFLFCFFQNICEISNLIKPHTVFLSCIQMDIINSDWLIWKLSDLYWNQFWNKIYNSLSNIWNFKRFKYPNYSRLSIHLDNIPIINKQVPIFFQKKVLVHSLSFAFIEI